MTIINKKKSFKNIKKEKSLKNIKLTIEYDGKNYNGWQKQPNNLNIQGEIELAIQKLTNETIDLFASGRTDSGVHALGQVANFKSNTNIPIEKLPIAINNNLKNSIVIKNAEYVPENFHARYSCKTKTYRYVINNSLYPSALDRNKEYHFPQKLDIEKMQIALNHFVGTYDFKGFRSSGTSNKNTIRTIYSTNFKYENGKIIIELTGNGFLYNMVRIIVGTLIDVGLGKIDENMIPKIIESKDRTKGGRTLPPHGLYLINVNY